MRMKYIGPVTPTLIPKCGDYQRHNRLANYLNLSHPSLNEKLTSELGDLEKIYFLYLHCQASENSTELARVPSTLIVKTVKEYILKLW